MSDACEHCPHEAAILVLKNGHEVVTQTLQRLEGKIDITNSRLADLTALEINHTHAKEALGRAYERIEKLEAKMETVDTELRAHVNHFRGAAKMAWVLWLLMGSGVVAVIGRLFTLPVAK